MIAEKALIQGRQAALLEPLAIAAHEGLNRFDLAQTLGDRPEAPTVDVVNKKVECVLVRRLSHDIAVTLVEGDDLDGIFGQGQGDGVVEDAPRLLVAVEPRAASGC